MTIIIDVLWSKFAADNGRKLTSLLSAKSWKLEKIEKKSFENFYNFLNKNIDKLYSFLVEIKKNKILNFFMILWSFKFSDSNFFTVF